MLRGYAALQAAAVRLGEADFTEMQNWLNPLIGDESPWRYSARELLGLAAFKAGNRSEARTFLTPLLVDQKTPQTIIERAQIVLAEIAAGEIAKKGAEAEARAAGATAAEGRRRALRRRPRRRSRGETMRGGTWSGGSASSARALRLAVLAGCCRRPAAAQAQPT